MQSFSCSLQVTSHCRGSDCGFTVVRCLQLKRGIAESVLPLFRKMDADSNGFLSYTEFRNAVSENYLNLGLNDDEVDLLIAAVDDTGKGAITFSDLSRRLVTGANFF